MSSRTRRAALAAAALLGLVTVARLPAAWASGNALNHVSGVWLTLADDLARGTFYRPVHAGALAYGGTRYFPLVFTLEAGLLRAGVPAVVAGEAVSLAAGLLLAAGVALLLAAAGARRGEALAAAALAFAGSAGQLALASARGDLLPVALSALALARVARAAPVRGRGAHLVPAALLVLAFAAKPTALSAAAAAIAALALRGGRRAALALGVPVAAGAAAVVLATETLSGGRFVAALQAAAAAGPGPRTALAAPARLAGEAAREDPAGLLLALLAAVALARAAPALLRAARRGGGDPRLVPALWLVAAWATALAVYAAPGTGVNHLLEVEVASAALLAASALGRGGVRASAARGACAAAALAGLVTTLSLWRADRTSSRLAEVRAVVAALPPGPVLSEDPLVPLLAGSSPLLLDPFVLRAAAAASPALARPLAAALRDGAVPAVVLLAEVDGPDAAAWFGGGDLGLPLVAELRRGYRPAGAFGRYHLYVPRLVAEPTIERADAGVVPGSGAR